MHVVFSIVLNLMWLDKAKPLRELLQLVVATVVVVVVVFIVFI